MIWSFYSTEKTKKKFVQKFKIFFWHWIHNTGWPIPNFLPPRPQKLFKKKIFQKKFQKKKIFQKKIFQKKIFQKKIFRKKNFPEINFPKINFPDIFFSKIIFFTLAPPFKKKNATQMDPLASIRELESQKKKKFSLFLRKKNFPEINFPKINFPDIFFSKIFFFTLVPPFKKKNATQMDPLALIRELESQKKNWISPVIWQSL